MWAASPLGKFQVLLKLFWGVDVTQRILGVDEDEAFDLHSLKPPMGRETLSSSQSREPHGPRGWGWSLGRLPGKCDGTVFTPQHEVNNGTELYLQHRVCYERKQMRRTKPKRKYVQTPAGVALVGKIMGWGALLKFPQWVCTALITTILKKS